jgi:LuxR family maltose regulon positive regulatory protein
MARRALADLPEEAQLVRAATRGLLGQAQLVSGDAVAAGHAFAEAAALGQPPHTLALALIAQGRLLQAQMLQGRFDLASATYHQILASAETHGVSDLPAVGVAQVYMAEMLREWNDLAGAEALVRMGITRCSEWPGLAEMALDGYITLARLLLAHGDTDGALAALDAAEALGRDAHVSQYAKRIALARARLWLGTGDEAELRRWAHSRQDTCQGEEKLGYLGLQERIMLARRYLGQGRPVDALARLDGLLATAEAGGLAGCTIEILLLRALSLQGQGQTAQAMMALNQALSLAEPQSYVRLFVDEGPRLVELLRQARSRGVAPSYIDELLAVSEAAGTTVTHHQVLAEPLSPRELELLRLLASGLSTSEIAGELYITTGTARNHLKNIFGKLDVHSRLQAVERARSLNVL